MAQFNVGSAPDFFIEVVSPLYSAFVTDNANVAKAVSAIVMSYHLFEWATDQKFEKNYFNNRYPEKPNLASDFETARLLTNGIKHDLDNIQTRKQLGFSSAFSSAFDRPLVIVRSDGSEISVDGLLRSMFEFWQEQHDKGWPL